MKKTRANVPAWLDDLAKKYWKQFVNDVNTDDAYLRETLGQYCSYLSEYRRANEQMIKEGMTVDTGNTIKPHPCMNIKNQAQTMIQRLSRILFTPDKDISKNQADELTDFFGE